MACTNWRSVRFASSPAQQCQEFGENHRRRAPDFVRRDVKTGDGEVDAVALALDAADGLRIEQRVNGNLEDVRDLAVGRRQPGTLRPRGDDRIQSKAADRN